MARHGEGYWKLYGIWRAVVRVGWRKVVWAGSQGWVYVYCSTTQREALPSFTTRDCCHRHSRPVCPFAHQLMALLLPDTSRLGICSLHKNTSGNTLCQMPIKVTQVKTSENFVSHSNLTLCWHFVQIIEISPRNSCSSILASQMAASVD